MDERGGAPMSAEKNRRPVNRRPVNVRAKAWKAPDGGRRPGVLVQVGDVQAWMEPSYALHVANKIVDALEQSEARHGGETPVRSA